MKKYIVFLFLLIIANQSFSQIIESFACKDSTQSKSEYSSFLIEFLKTQSFNNALDIGSGNLEHILTIANEFPTKNFTLEDIDSTYLNIKQLNLVVDYLNLEKVNQQNIQFQFGKSNNTLLPKNTYDVVITSGLIHEIDSLSTFLEEIKRVLKPDGILIIYDAFYYEKPTNHMGCHNPFLTIEEFEKIAQNPYFEVKYVRKLVGVKDGKNRPYESIINICKPIN